MKNKIVWIFVLILLLTMPQLVIGANNSTAKLLSGEDAVNDIKNTIGKVTELIQLIGACIGVAVLSAGGVMFMTAGDSPEKKEQAKQVLTMAVVGLLVILIAPSIVGFIVS